MTALFPLSPAPVTVAVDGQYAWSFAYPSRGIVAGSANQDTFTSSTESMIKPWIAADYLRRTANPPAYRLDELSRMIRNSDDNAAQDIYRLDGSNAVVARMRDVCGLLSVRIRPFWWSYTTLTADDAVRLGLCLQDGRAAGTWTTWLLDVMRRVAGTVDQQQATTGGGHWGIVDALPARVAADTAIKNGYTPHGDTYAVNCLAVHPGFVLAIMMRYPVHLGLRYGADVCAAVTRQLLRRPSQVQFR